MTYSVARMARPRSSATQEPSHKQHNEFQVLPYVTAIIAGRERDVRSMCRRLSHVFVGFLGARPSKVGGVWERDLSAILISLARAELK